MPGVINPRSVSLNIDRAEDDGIYYNVGRRVMRDFATVFGYEFQPSSITKNGKLNRVDQLAAVSGVGSEIGVHQNFDAITFSIYPYTAAVLPQHVQVYVREGSGTGTILGSALVPLDGVIADQSLEVTAEFGQAIANAGGAELYLQLWTDGLIGYAENQTTPSSEFVRYVTNKDLTYTGAGSLVVSSTYKEIFAKSFLSGTTNVNANGYKFAVLYDTGGFSGWGSILPAIPPAFNCAQIFAYASNASLLPTKVRIRFRDTNSAGAIIATAVSAVDFTTTGQKLLSFFFDSDVDLSAYDTVWVEYISDGQLGFAYSSVNTGSSTESYATVRDIDTDVSLVLAGAIGRGVWLRTSKIDKSRTFGFNVSRMIQQIRASGGGGTTSPYTPAADVLLPDTVFAVQNYEFNIYLDGAIDSHVPLDSLRVKGGTSATSTGKMESHRFVYTPAGTGSHSVDLEVFNNGVSLKSASTTLSYKAESVGNGQTRKCLVIGDSIVAGGVVVSTAAANITNNGDSTYACTFIGTQDGSTHEARNGWKYSDVVGASSPFYNSGAFDFSYYLSNNSLSMAAGDSVFLLLGTNDLFNYTTDEGVNAECLNIAARIDEIITSIRAYDSNIHVWIGMVAQPAYGQTAWSGSGGAGYGGTNDWEWRVKRNYALYRRFLIDTYDGLGASDKTWLCPVHFCVDTRNNYKTTTRAVNARNSATETIAYDPVHPSADGEKQLGDMLYACLMSLES